MASGEDRIEQPQSPDSELEARRRLLKLAAYAPPAILGVMIANTKTAEAALLGQTKNCKSGNIVISAGGNACCPCVPGDPKYDPIKCIWERCELGNCKACPPGLYLNSKDCAKVSQACGCACQKTKTAVLTVWNCN